MSTIAVAQFAPGTDPVENLARMSDLAEHAVARGATLIVFPEYSSYFTPEMGDDWLLAAQRIDGEFVAGLSELARRLSVHLVAGLVEKADSSHVRNALVAIDQSGDLVAAYRKVHLYDAFGACESDWIQPGAIEDPETFEWAGFTVGMQTCYDIRFPEMTRRLVDAGADLVLVPSEWVRGPLKEH
ncbi:MAG: nitrilase-related carbon-nitrogen hydrolase, partial [Rhodoglobus sp.]|nr:nitrilase-related carbon-nitrogen hydrolase [Rhodoglobus sp.]